ncbi:MAG: hypothetical protein U0324_01795 [Polyangiales bacterium]
MMKRLAWSLGEPLVVGDAAVGDPDSLARAVLSRPELRELLASSTPRATSWRGSNRCHRCCATSRGRPPPPRPRRRAPHQRPTSRAWRGLYQHARTTTLTVADGAGNAVVLTSPALLRVTAQVADVWDSLKRAL